MNTTNENITNVDCEDSLYFSSFAMSNLGNLNTSIKMFIHCIGRSLNDIEKEIISVIFHEELSGNNRQKIDFFNEVKKDDTILMFKNFGENDYYWIFTINEINEEQFSICNDQFRVLEGDTILQSLKVINSPIMKCHI